MMDSEKIWELWMLKLSGEATEGQLLELGALMRQHPALVAEFTSVEAIWRGKGKVEPEEEGIDDLYNKHLQRLSDEVGGRTALYEGPQAAENETGRRRPARKWLVVGAVAAAACFAIIFIGGGASSPVSGGNGNFVSTRNGSKSKLQLPDGTQVWLNSGSNISYDNDFGEKMRQVRLTGEAFFDVVKDNAHPFIIHTARVDVTVLGTAFNVRSYPEEKVTETSLIKGAVEVTLKASADKRILLKPNEKLIVSNDSSMLKNDPIPAGHKERAAAVMTLTRVHHLDRDSVASEVLWTRNKLVFDGEVLSEVALKLERWYGVKVTIQGEELKDIPYTGVFDDDNLTEVLYALQLSGGFKYVIKRNEVIIRP
jgi:ferric-dicitrate binding protein FerR (iron transport regulator)